MIKRELAILVILLIIANIADSMASASSLDEEEDDENDFHEYFQEYFTYQTMMDALDYLEAKHPEIVKVYDLTETIDENRKGIPSETWQGHKVWAVKVSDGVDEEPDYYSDPNEADVLFIGAHHGNEWTSFEVPLYFLFYLVENYGRGPTDNDGDGEINEDPVDGIDNDGDGSIDEDEIEGRVTWLVDNREIWIVPMQNPDGVVADTRKNGRTTVPGPIGENIPTSGVNTNRNYPFMWGSPYDPQTGQTMDTPNPQASEYRGPKDGYDDDGDSLIRKEIRPGVFRWIDDPNNVDEDPVNNKDDDNDGNIDEDPDGGFSEPETVAIGNLVEALDWNEDGTSDIITCVSYHTYGEWIIYPWGYTSDPAPHSSLLNYVGQELSDFNGYTLLQGPELYPTSGDVDDWLYGKHKIFSYTLELGSDDDGYKVEEKNIINVSMLNLPCSLYLAEMAPLIEVARERFIPTLDIGLPVINHTQKKKVINSDFTFPVEVEISNSNKLIKNSVNMYYKAGESGEWKMRPMTKIDDEHYKATIPRHSGGKNIYYYFEAKASYNEAKSVNEVIYVYSPKYGQHDPHSYFVDISLGDTLGDLAAMIIMVVLIFGIIYTGLGKSLKMAVDAEKRKSIT
ncbi:MAG: hypothetical protein JSV56_00490 [Methanomassiliicoccales archaeon]|nr:MAG: hypothetical protein JSV56_00490 [Methanomassiliicoccales archaeon]